MPRRQPEALPEPSARSIELLEMLADDDFWADLDIETQALYGMVAFISRDWVRGEAASVLATHYHTAGSSPNDWQDTQQMAKEILEDIRDGDY